MDVVRSPRGTDLQAPPFIRTAQSDEDSVQPRLVARDGGVEAQALLVKKTRLQKTWRLSNGFPLHRLSLTRL